MTTSQASIASGTADFGGTDVRRSTPGSIRCSDRPDLHIQAWMSIVHHGQRHMPAFYPVHGVYQLDCGHRVAP